MGGCLLRVTVGRLKRYLKKAVCWMVWEVREIEGVYRVQ